MAIAKIAQNMTLLCYSLVFVWLATVDGHRLGSAYYMYMFFANRSKSVAVQALVT